MSYVFDGESKPPLALKTWTLTIEADRVGTISGKQLVTSFRRREVHELTDGKTNEYDETITLRNIRFDTNWNSDPFVVSTIIPDGSRVTVQEEEQIAYEWRGGKVVKVVDQTVLATASAQEFVAPTAPNRRYLWIGIAVATMGMIAFMIRLYRRRRVTA